MNFTLDDFTLGDLIEACEEYKYQAKCWYMIDCIITDTLINMMLSYNESYSVMYNVCHMCDMKGLMNYGYDGGM